MSNRTTLEGTVALVTGANRGIGTALARLIDVDLVVNNAGVALGARLIGAADLSAARQEMEVNYFGLLRMCRAFAPILAANGGGALINVLSILARVASPAVGSYSASKASALSLTQAVRAELQAQGTRVIGVRCQAMSIPIWPNASLPRKSSRSRSCVRHLTH